LGTLLGKKLKTRNEERSLVTPRMKSGRLSGRMIHEIGFGNFDIFERTMATQVNPALLHITIDASSSMGGSKWDNTQVAAVAIAKAASMTQNMDVVISYRAIHNNRNGKYQPLVLIAYDSRKDKFSKIQQLFKHIVYDGTTPEGLCFEAIMKQLTQVKKGTDTYFINFSDGYPGFDNSDINYCGDQAVNHTADQVKKIRSYGVNVLSYFITDSYGQSGGEQFRKMYGKDAAFINVTQVSELAKTLNEKFQVNI
jgi:nitric oxide reductase activation protein